MNKNANNISLITSEHNSDYFIVNNGVFNITYLISILSTRNKTAFEELSSVLTIPDLKNEKIIIKKNSILGIELVKLIDEQIIFDENNIIRDLYLKTALISAVINKEEDLYIDFIANLIKENINGPITYLKELYDEELLQRINIDGRINNYINENKVLTGFEDKGITYQNNNWQYIDIAKKDNINIKRKNKVTN